jgi:hypothetical protein
VPQGVPQLEWSEDALAVRRFTFDFWFAEARPPSLMDVHRVLGLERQAIVQAYKELELGLVVTIDQTTQNANLLKAPPFASFPTNYQMFVDDEFHSFIGCAHEVLGASNSPQVRGATLRFESACACCLEPISLRLRDFEVLAAEPTEPLIHVSETPWYWLNRDMISMCDVTNFVLDRQHGERYERMQGRRGVYFTLDQAREYVRFVAEARIWDYHWAAMSLDPAAILERMASLGIDVSPWTP